MYGIFAYIYPKHGPNVGKYSIHGASGYICVYIYICRYVYIYIYVDICIYIYNIYVDAYAYCVHVSTWDVRNSCWFLNPAQT